MEKEATFAGVYQGRGRKFLKLQILTAAQVIDGKRLKRASRESGGQSVGAFRELREAA